MIIASNIILSTDPSTMEFKVRSLESILAKIVKEQSDAGKWNGEKRGFWQWKNYFIPLLQEEKIYHWFDGRSTLIPYPREALDYSSMET